jgi:pyruvate ferredoxin oxidoreductase alpha subunit
MTNSFTTMAKAAVKELRKDGKKVGLLRIRLVRPFPRQDVAAKLAGKKGVAVLDQNISIGSGGILYPEIQSALYHRNDRPQQIVSFIGGLGGKRISLDEFKHVLGVTEMSVKEGTAPLHSVMLFTDKDWGAVKGMLQIAGKEMPEGSS